MAKLITLNNGRVMPIIGIGTWLNASPKQAIKAALAAGYRHIDTAAVYYNEAEIGEALHGVLQQGNIKREDVFVTTKLSSVCMSPSEVKPAFMVSLKHLQLSYIDLFLIHFPVASKERMTNFDPNVKLATVDIDYLDTWKAMEDLVEEGLVRSIGVSNFNHLQLQRVLDHSRIKPANNQIEVHPLLNNFELVDYCLKRGVTVTAYCPLASPGNVGRPKGQIDLLQETSIIDIAEKHNKTPAQVLIKYPIQRGLIVIPKSESCEHIKSNLQIFDFELTEEDLKTLKGYEAGWRVWSGAMWSESRHYPWETCKPTV